MLDSDTLMHANLLEKVVVTVEVNVVVTEDVADLVTVDVAVVVKLVDLVEVPVVVADELAVDLAVVDTDVVADEVTDDVTVVEGDVISQSKKSPFPNLVSAFVRTSASLVQVLASSLNKPPPAHTTEPSV